MRMLRFTCFFGIGLSFALHGEPALAQPAKGSDAISETARDLYKKGEAAAIQPRWDQCRAAYLAAFAIKKQWQIAGNLGDCEVELGLYRDAAEHLAYYLETAPASVSADRLKVGRAQFDKARSKIGILRVTASVEGAEISVDGTSVGKGPVRAFVDPGSHTLEARLEGYTTAKATLDTQAGSERDVGLSLERPPSVPVSQLLPAKPHVPPERPPWPIWPVYAGGALSVTSAGVAIAFLVNAGNKKAAADDLSAGHVACPDGCEELKSAYGKADTSYDVSTGLFVTAAIAAVGTVAYALVRRDHAEKSQEPTSSPQVAPVVGGSYRGLALTGQF